MFFQSITHNPFEKNTEEGGRQKALLYRIGLSSNTATPLALFVLIELLCFVAVFVNKHASLRIRILLHNLSSYDKIILVLEGTTG